MPDHVCLFLHHPSPIFSCIELVCPDCIKIEADNPLASPTPYHEILAHPAPITSLTLSPSHPHGLLSAASDCSIRVWDLDKKTSVQDCAGHRQRSGEGVVGLARHPELPVVASAGADGVVRVWSAA